MTYTIYLRTNKINGKQYVGQTKDFERREYNWYNTNWEYAGKCINAAREKYGTENFTTDILKECSTQEESNKWEMYYIKELNTKVPNGYNLTDGGEGSIGCVFSDERKKRLSEIMKGENNHFFGKHHTEETKRKIAEKAKGRKHTEEAKKKMKGRPSPNKGKHLSEETRQKLREFHLGMKASEETRKKISDANKGEKSYMYGKHHSEETKRKISDKLKGRFSGNKNPMYGKKRKGSKLTKQVYQYTLDNQLVKVWDSASQAARELGFGRGCIKDCCHGGKFDIYNGERKWYKCLQYKGYKWSYEPL